MRYLLCLTIVAGSITGSGSAAWGAIMASSTDLWQGATILTHSGVHPNSNINDMFGAVSAASEAGNTVFRDSGVAGTLHSVEWQTAAAITLRSFVLIAAHDQPPRDITYRGFSTFRLLADTDNSGSFETTIFQISPSNPYGNTPAPPNSLVETNAQLNALLLAVNVLPTLSQRFRAEFIQAGGPDPSARGPRIVELDGFNTFRTDTTIPDVGSNSVPEPTSIAAWLMLLGTSVWTSRRIRGSQGTAT
jgi:hypothetical protein